MPTRKPVEPEPEELSRDAVDLSHEMTMVPEMFLRMPDAVLSVAMQHYQDALDAGRSEEDALTEGVIAGKEWAQANKMPYRKGERWVAR